MPTSTRDTSPKIIEMSLGVLYYLQDIKNNWNTFFKMDSKEQHQHE